MKKALTLNFVATVFILVSAFGVFLPKNSLKLDTNFSVYSSLNVSSSYTQTDKSEQDNIEKEIIKEINWQIDGLDLSEIEKIIEKFENEGQIVFGNTGIAEKVKQIITGEYKLFSDGVVQAVVNLILEKVLKILPLFASILAVGIISSMLGQFRLGSNGKGIGDIIHFVCYGLILILVSGVVLNLLSNASKTIGVLKELIDIIFPILLTLLTALGGTTSVSVYQPAVALFSGTILNIFNSVLVPLFVFSFVFTVISNLTTTVKLTKFADFFSSIFKWIVGIVFSLFVAFVSIQGISAGSFDGISIKTAKFAMKTYIPILGGYLADGINVVMASSVLVKNAIGVCGLLILFALILSPVVDIVLFSLVLKLAASVLEPLTDSRIANFLSAVAKCLNMLIAIIVGVSFMFLFLIALMMMTANYA